MIVLGMNNVAHAMYRVYSGYFVAKVLNNAHDPEKDMAAKITAIGR